MGTAELPHNRYCFLSSLSKFSTNLHNSSSAESYLCKMVPLPKSSLCSFLLSQIQEGIKKHEWGKGGAKKHRAEVQAVPAAAVYIHWSAAAHPRERIRHHQTCGDHRPGTECSAQSSLLPRTGTGAAVRHRGLVQGWMNGFTKGRCTETL